MKLDSLLSLRLRDFLEERLSQFRLTMRDHALREDPIGLVYPYVGSQSDAEVVALLSSSLAYGQRKVFVPVVARLLTEMGSSPYDFVMSDGHLRKFDWFKYRFNKPDDIRCLLFSMKRAFLAYGSLERAFLSGFSPDEDINTYSSLSSFVSLLRGADFSSLGIAAGGSTGLSYLLPDPTCGGACKRLNMFLRWMFRKDEVDLNIWSGIPLDRLVIPLDTHVRSVSLKLGLTSRSGSTWKCAEDITDSLRQFDPTDPLKYDFLLFSLGVWKAL